MTSSGFAPRFADVDEEVALEAKLSGERQLWVAFRVAYILVKVDGIAASDEVMSVARQIESMTSIATLFWRQHYEARTARGLPT